MKKKLLLISLFFLSWCSSIVSTPVQNTWDIEKVSQLEQQLSGLFKQFSWLQQENVALKGSLSEQLANLKMLSGQNEVLLANLSTLSIELNTVSLENESLKADVVKYKNALVQNMLNNKSSGWDTTVNNIQTSATNTSTVNTSQSTPTITKNYGNIKDIYSVWGKNYIKIDYVEKADCEIVICEASWPRRVDNNPLIRTFEVSNNAIFEVFKFNPEGSPQDPNRGNMGLKSIDRSEFKIRGNCNRNTRSDDAPETYIYYGCWKDTVVEIEHDSQKIYNVTAIYQN